MSRIIYAKTHADFLNQAFGTDYKGYMKSRWDLDNDTWVWMVYIDEQVRSGWVNKIISEDQICEEYVWSDEPTYKNEPERAYRIVVRIVNTTRGREYHVLGKYKIDFVESTNKKHILKKIAEI